MLMQVLIHDKRERKNVVMFNVSGLLRLTEWKKRHMDLDGEWASTMEENDLQEIVSVPTENEAYLEELRALANIQRQDEVTKESGEIARRLLAWFLKLDLPAINFCPSYSDFRLWNPSENEIADAVIITIPRTPSARRSSKRALAA